MPCVNGSKLSDSARREVLSAFGYRWTAENEKRARQWYKTSKMEPPTAPLISDGEWLDQHAFHVVKDSTRLSARLCHAEPACMADDWTPETADMIVNTRADYQEMLQEALALLATVAEHLNSDQRLQFQLLEAEAG